MLLRSRTSPLGRTLASSGALSALLCAASAQGASEGSSAGAYGTPPSSEGAGKGEEFGEGAYGGPTTPEDELADVPPPDKAEVSGTYVRLTAGLTFTPGNNHAWSDPANCPSADLGIPGVPPWTPSCSATQPIGFLAEFKLGYSFGVVGLEGFALGAGDWSSGSLDDLQNLPIGGLPDFAKDMQIGRIGGGFGGNFRLPTLPGPVRLSGGLGGGAMLRYVYSNVTSLDGSSVNYAAPMMRADVGLVLFNFLTAGIMGWMEFSKDVALTPDFSQAIQDPTIAQALEDAVGDVTVYQGNQLFLGLFVGLHMGK